MKLVSEEVVKRVDLVRKEFGYSYPQFADLVGFDLKGDTLRKAIARKKLKEIFVLSIINKLDINQTWMFQGTGEMKSKESLKTSNIYLEKDGVKIYVKEIIKFLDDNHELLEEIDDDYGTWIENRANMKMFKVFRENNIEYKVIVNNSTEK